MISFFLIIVEERREKAQVNKVTFQIVFLLYIYIYSIIMYNILYSIVMVVLVLLRIDNKMTKKNQGHTRWSFFHQCKGSQSMEK